MFNFDKIKMNPSYSANFEPPATEAQIEELEKYCGHVLPEKPSRTWNLFSKKFF